MLMMGAGMELRTKGDLLTWEIKRQEAEGLREGVCGETRRGTDMGSKKRLKCVEYL